MASWRFPGVTGHTHIIVGGFVYFNPKRLRRPEERVGTLTNAALPPPVVQSADAMDVGLVRSLRARDNQAGNELVDRYYEPMLRIATRFVRGRADAEEVIQETWLAVLSGIDRFEGRSSFKTWLFRILMNRARTRASRAARTVPFSAIAARTSRFALNAEHFEAGSPMWTGAASRSRTPEEELLASELGAKIDAAVAALPAHQRAVLTLRDIEGRSTPEVCAELRISEINQRVLLHRARARVRAALTPYVTAGIVS